MSELAPLTDRQRLVLGFIREACLTGKPPSIRELCGKIGCTSTNGVMFHVRALRRKGYLKPDGGTKDARDFRLANPEIAARGKGDSLTVSTTGPVTMTREAWRQWWETNIGK